MTVKVDTKNCDPFANIKEIEIPDTLYYLMLAAHEYATEKDFPDGAWQAYLEEHVEYFNSDPEINEGHPPIDPLDGFQAFVKRHGEEDT